MKDPALYLIHILEATRRIERYSQGGRERFFSDEMVRDATIRNFEVMGEAAKRVPFSVRQRAPTIPWKSLVAFRNVLIHGYDGLVLDRIWETIAVELPRIVPELERLLSEFGVNPEEI